MSLRNRITPQQLLAVSFALIMLVSMGGMAFIGGAGAQTGGTADELIVDERPAEDLNVDDGIQLTGTEDDLDNGNVDVESDGSITVEPDNAGDNEFSGVTATPNRVGVDDDEELATGLDDAVDDVEVEGDATPIVVIELAPQSNVSQTDDVDGDHDFIVIGQEDELPGDITSDSADTDISAYAVNNTDFEDSNEVTDTDDTDDFGSTIGDLVGTSESDLQNENVDDFRIGAGTFGNGDVDVNALQISDDAVEGETIHSELIALDDGDDERYFNSVTNATSEASDGDTVTALDGTYTDLEDDPIELSNNDLTVSGAGEDTNLNTNVNVTGNNVTVEGFDINDDDSDADGIVDVDAENTTLQQLTVDQGATGETGIDIASEADSVATTVDNVTVNADDEDTVEGEDTGLALDTNEDEEVSVTNSTFVGHETQIDGNDNVDEGELLEANNFEGEDAQSAVARNTDGEVVGNAIYGSINQADAEDNADGSIDVSAGTYDHGDETLVTIDTDNVTVTDTDDAATVENDLDVASDAGDVVVNDFDVDAVSTTGANLDSLTFNGTTAESFDVADGDATNATLTDTDAGDAGDYDVTASDTVDVDGAVGDIFTLDGDSAVDVSGADGDEFTLDSTGDVTVSETVSAGAVTTEGEPDDVTITDGSASTYDIATVTGDVEVTGATTTAGGIDVPDSAQNTSVEDANITLDANDGIGVDITASGDENEVISVTDTAVDGNEMDGTGIELTDVDSGVTAEYTIEDNNLTNFGDGTGLDIAEQESSGREADISISDNAIAGGSEFIGIRADLSAAEDVVFVGNDIVGADVSGGTDSVGIKFEEAPNFGGGFLGGGDGAAFNNNTITGHARLIEDNSAGDEPPIRSEDYTSIINDLDNDFGTLVIGPDGNYEDTYGDDIDINDGSEDGAVYLPGSINQSVNLVGDSPEVESADLQVYETDVEVSDAISSTPDTYEDDPVVFPNADDITVSGESEEVAANTTFEITEDDQRNNHDIRSLTINSDGDAITVNTDKAQSEFTNLDVTADGTGLDVNPEATDVNVIEVRDSDFDVGDDGISLAGTNDDRDGFVIDNVDVVGDGLGADGTGLDLSSVEKPGKDGLPVNFTVKDSSVANFTTQVAVDDGGNLDESGVDAAAFANDEDVTADGITVENNTFEQAVLVYDEEGGELQSNDLYGSVDEADGDAAGTGDFIDVRNLADGDNAAVYDHGETVTIATDSVTVAGPVDEPGSADVRDDETVIADSVEVTNNDVTLEGLAVVGDDSLDVLDVEVYGADDATLGGTVTAVIGANGDDLTVEDVSVTSSVDPKDDGAMPVGIATNSGGELTVESSFVGDHDNGTTGSAIVAQSGTLDVDDSTLEDGEHGIDFSDDELDSSAYGVIAADGTNPTITNTSISEFAGDGINTGAVDLTIEDGSTIDDNNAETVSNNVDDTTLDDAGDGGVVTNDAAGTFEIDASDVTDNNGVGVDVTVDSLDITDDATIDENDDDGVVVEATDTVDVLSSAVSDNGGTGLDVSGDAAVEVSDSDVGSNAATVDSTDNATVENSTFSADGATALTLDTNDADVTQNTIEDSDTGLELTTETTDPVVTRNTIAGNELGFLLNEDADDAVVTGNDLDNDERDIEYADEDGTLDATLNYFGTEKGPESDAAGGVTDNVVYDPFLTSDQTDNPVDEVTETVDFGHDVVIPGDSVTTVGFPATPDAGDGEDATLADVFDSDMDGTLYAFDADAEEFTSVDAAEFEDTDVEAFDAFVVENTEEDAESVLIDYEDDPGAGSVADTRHTFQEGLNFVAPSQAGTVEESLLVGQPTDEVIQPFSTGENLYGTDAPQVRDTFVSPDGTFGDSFETGAGDRVVHPHAGYLVDVNEETTVGQSTYETITTPDGPTADNVADRTDNAPAATNVDTGESYDNLQSAFAQADAGDQIQLGTGTLDLDSASARDNLTVDTDGLTVTGAGTAATTVDGGLNFTGDNVVLADFTVEGDLTLDGADATTQNVDVVANSPGSLVINGAGASVSNANVEEDLDVNADNTVVSDTSVDQTLNTEDAPDDTTVSVRDSTFTSLGGASNPSFSFAGSTDVQVLTEANDKDLSGVTFTSDARYILMPGDYTGNGAAIDDATLTSAPQADASDVTISGVNPSGDSDVLEAATDGGAIEDVTIQSDSGQTGVTLGDDGATLDGVVFESLSDDTTYVDDTAGNDVDLQQVIDDNTFAPGAVEDESASALVDETGVAVVNVDQRLAFTDAELQTAVDEADEGDTIQVAGDSTYTQDATGVEGNGLTVNTEGLTLEGPNAGTNGASDNRDAEATIEGPVFVGADDVTIDGFTIDDTNAGNLADAPGPGAVQLNQVSAGESADGTTLSNNIIEAGTNDNDLNAGVAAIDVVDVTIERNLFTEDSYSAVDILTYESTIDIETRDNTDETTGEV